MSGVQRMQEPIGKEFRGCICQQKLSTENVEASTDWSSEAEGPTRMEFRVNRSNQEWVSEDAESDRNRIQDEGANRNGAYYILHYTGAKRNGSQR